MFGFLSDVASIAVSPLRVAANLAEHITAPLAQAAKDVVETTKLEKETKSE